jgi:hypothetical protein
MEPTPPADPRLRARRAAVIVLVWSFLGILGGLSFVTEQVRPRYVPLQMRRYAPPTEAWLATSDALRTVPGVVAAFLVAVLASRLMARGAADRHLRWMTFALVVAMLLLLAFVAVTLYLPFVKGGGQRISS